MELETAGELAIAPMVGIVLLAEHLEKHGTIDRAALALEVDALAAKLPHAVAALMLGGLAKLLREPVSSFDLRAFFGAIPSNPNRPRE